MPTVYVYLGAGTLVVRTIIAVLDHLNWRSLISRTRDEHLPLIARHFGRRH